MPDRRRVLLPILLALVFVMTSCQLSEMVSNLDDEIATDVAREMTPEGPIETAAPLEEPAGTPRPTAEDSDADIVQPTVEPSVTPTPFLEPSGEDGAALALGGRLAQIYEQVNPSVVNIQTIVQGLQAFPEGFGQPQQPQGGLGSGFVWDQQGHIVTNNHVIAGASDIAVIFNDGYVAPGEVVGTDPASDLAVIRIDVPAEQLRPVQVASSSEVHVGEVAIALGNPFGLQGTMTVGIVSALGRSLPVEGENTLSAVYTIPDIIQTDAAINPGNSGGVLVDEQGRLIGVTAAIRSPVEANAGIGFAIPSDIVRKVVPALIAEGRYQHPWLGISGTSLVPPLAQAMNLPAEQRGVLVATTTPGSPADEAGLRGSDRQASIDGLEVAVGGDVIVAIDGEQIRTFEEMVSYLARNTEVGQTVTLTVLRDGQQQDIPLTLGARPGS